MSDSKGDAHGKGEDKKGSGDDDRTFMVDRFFARVTNFVSDEIAKLVLFVFVLITIGAVIGFVVAERQFNPVWIFAPAVVGIIAYYERDIAILLFVAIILFVFL